MYPGPSNLSDLLSKVELDRAIDIVKGQIMSRYNRQVKPDEAEGWAQLGICKAFKGYDPARLTGAPSAGRLMAFLVSKGFFEAVDEMRSAKVVDRQIRGKLKKTCIDAKSFSVLAGEVGEHDESMTFDPEDGLAVDPTAQSLAEDIYRWAVERLSLSDADLVYYYYVCKVPMRQIGMLFSCSESRVSQNHTRVLERLRAEHDGTQTTD